jgi:hypothetical protein
MDALLSPQALVLPARGWPAGTFANCPPERRYRVRYLRDVRLELEQQRSEALARAKAALPAQVARIRASHVTPGEVMTTLNTLDTLQSRAEPALGEALVEQVLDGVRALARGAVQIERGVARRLLDFIVEHRDLWNVAWQKDLHIVGETNLGELRFDPATDEAIGRLWWWHPEDADAPTPASEYRWPLTLPTPAEAPPLPPRDEKRKPKQAPSRRASS